MEVFACLIIINSFVIGIYGMIFETGSNLRDTGMISRQLLVGEY
jgi:hypothetical protein